MTRAYVGLVEIFAELESNLEAPLDSGSALREHLGHPDRMRVVPECPQEPVEVHDINPARIARTEPLDLLFIYSSGGELHPGHLLFDADNKFLGWAPTKGAEPPEERLPIYPAQRATRLIPAGGGKEALREYLLDQKAAALCRVEIIQKTLEDLDLTDAERAQRAEDRCQRLVHDMELVGNLERLEEEEARRAAAKGKSAA